MIFSNERGSIIDNKEEFQDDNKFFHLINGFHLNENFPGSYRSVMFSRYLYPYITEDQEQFIKDQIILDIRVANLYYTV